MSKLSPVYLLLGPEKGQKTEFITGLKSQIASKNHEEPEEYKYYTFDTKLNDVISLLRNGSLFSKHKIVIIAGIDEVKKKDELATLLEYCAKPSDGATLVLTSDQIYTDSKLDKAVPAEAKKIFWELFDNQKTGWISGYFSREGMKIERDAADLLLEMVENDTQDIGRECFKLTMFFPQGTTISAADIEKYIYHSKEENVFTLFEEIVSLNFPLSLEILQKILLSKDSNPVQLISGLLWQLKRLLAMKELTEKNYSLQDAFTKLNIRSKRHQKIYAEGGKNFSLPELQRIISLSAEYDSLFRQVRSDITGHLLQMYLYAIIRRKGAPVKLPVL